MTSTRFWIPFGVMLLCLTFVSMPCVGHWKPVHMYNDLGEPVKMDASSHKILDASNLNSRSIKSGNGFGLAACSKHWEFAYFSTQSHPEFVAYRVKDICDPDDCSCEIRASDLERRRRDLSVPWREAGSVFPPSAKR